MYTKGHCPIYEMTFDIRYFKVPAKLIKPPE